MAQREEMATIDQGSARRLTEAIGQLHGLGNAVRLELLSLVAEVEEQSLYLSDGASSTESWLCLQLDMSRRSACEMAAVARALVSLPKIAEAFGTGLLSWDKLVVLAGFVKPEEDTEFAGEATKLNLEQLKLVASHRKEISLLEAKEIERKRHLKISWSRDKRFARLKGLFPAEQAMVIQKALERQREQLPGNPDGTYGCFEHRSADALVEIMGAAIARDRDPDRATVVVHVDADVLDGLKDGSGRLENGAPIHAEAARRLSCDSRMVFVAEKDGQPVGIGRVSRSFPPWMVRMLKERDPECLFPGCSNTQGLQGHHINHWARGAKTNMDEVGHWCPIHHRLLHDGGWSLRGSPQGQLHHIKPDGTVLQTGPPLLRQEVYARIFSPEVSGPLVPA